MLKDQPSLVKHSTLDDIQGLGLGLFLCSLGVHLLTHLGFITGQTAGIALILSYVTGISFGLVFFVVNLPFYWLAWRRLGPAFTVKSLVSVTILSVLTEILPDVWRPGDIQPVLGALMIGSFVGVGLLVLFRHNGSLGGIGVLALYVQDTTGFRAGYVQLLADAVIFMTAFLLFDPTTVLYSLLGAAVINVIIAVNHRRDRYIAT